MLPVPEGIGRRHQHPVRKPGPPGLVVHADAVKLWKKYRVSGHEGLREA